MKENKKILVVVEDGEITVGVGDKIYTNNVDDIEGPERTWVENIISMSDSLINKQNR